MEVRDRNERHHRIADPRIVMRHRVLHRIRGFGECDRAARPEYLLRDSVGIAGRPRPKPDVADGVSKGSSDSRTELQRTVPSPSKQTLGDEQFVQVAPVLRVVEAHLERNDLSVVWAGYGDESRHE